MTVEIDGDMSIIYHCYVLFHGAGTIANSGRLTLPEDTMTKVPKQAAWEYCVYAGDNDYGFYDQNNSKVSKPFGMLVVKTPGPSGIIKVKISKSLINNPDAIRYTIATFAPSQPPNRDTLFQGGSSAVDVFPGTRETFGGEINGYGESTPLGDGMTSDYTIYYVYNGINPIVEYAPNGSVLARYIYAGGRHIAKVAGADTHWYHCDALGSPRKMTDERGSTVWSATYYPFGEMTAGSNNTHGFTGKEFDSEMGLNYFCQRYYDPEIGRFTTLDPFAGYIELPQSQNRYAYCIGNPLKYIDPLGLVYQVIVHPDYGLCVYPSLVTTAPRYIQDEPYDWGYMEGFGNTGILKQGFGDYYDGCGGNHGGKGSGMRRYGSGKSGGGGFAPPDALSFTAPKLDFPSWMGYDPLVSTTIVERMHREWLSSIGEREGLIDVSFMIDMFLVNLTIRNLSMTSLLRARIGIHTDHLHHFGRLGIDRHHFQLNLWSDGIKGSGSAHHFPFPPWWK